VVKYLIVIVGPTGVGKTEVAIELALHFNTEILSADSRQFYRELNIGTAKPTSQQLSRINHYFINSLTILDDYNAGNFESDALKILEECFQHNQTLILCGGSGLYINAVCQGLDEIPHVPDGVREALNQEFALKGLNDLLEELKSLDPIFYQKIDKNNPQRVIRALEVCRSTGRPYSTFRHNKKKDREFKIIKIGLERDREELYLLIEQRVDDMIASGLFEEAEGLFVYRLKNALQTVGYQEIFGYLEGAYDREEAVRLLKRNTKRYVKRQFTWFKKDPGIQWFHPREFSSIINFITQIIKKY